MLGLPEHNALNSEFAQSALCLLVDAHCLDWIGHDHYCVHVQNLVRVYF